MNTKYKILTYGYDPQGRETIGVCNADDELDAKDDALREVCLLDAYKAEIYVLSRVFVDGKHVEVYELIKTYIKK